MHSKSVLMDTLVKVRGFIILIDFVVLDCEEVQEISILLIRPFLATSKLAIDLEWNELIKKLMTR